MPQLVWINPYAATGPYFKAFLRIVQPDGTLRFVNGVPKCLR